MQSENRILGNQLVIMSREDLDALVNEMAPNIVAAQTKSAQNDLETWMNVPEGERFITREEAAHILLVNFTTLWRWDKQGHLHSRKIGGYLKPPDCSLLLIPSIKPPILRKQCVNNMG